MTFVNITALSFPPAAAAEIEKRFAARKKGVDRADGFAGFELLRPVTGEDRYFVITRWDSQEAYEAWSAGRDEHAHDGDVQRGMSVDVMGFEVV